MATIEEVLLKDIAFKSDFVATPTGDLDVVSGLDNIKEALFRMLVTTPGSLVHRPNYGVNIKKFQNAINSMETQRRMASEIQENFEKDPRVEKVLGVSITNQDLSPEKIKVNVRVKIVGYGESQFSFIPFGDY